MAFSLPTYDEFLVGFSSFGKSRTGGQDVSQKVVFDSMIVIGGRIAGSWRRTFKKGAVVIEIAPFAALTAAEDAAIAHLLQYRIFVLHYSYEPATVQPFPHACRPPPRPPTF